MGDSDNIKAGTQVALEVLKAVKDEPDVKQAGKNVAKSLSILTETVTNILLPLAALNYTVAKAKLYFQTKFQSEIQEKASQIPAEHLQEPAATIAGPSLQGITFAIDEPPLKEMFLNLLVASMDGRTPDRAHPAFAEIIRQLTSAEALMLEKFFTRTPTAIARLGLGSYHADKGETVLRNYIADHRDPSGTPVDDERFEAFVDNWCRFGLVGVDYGRHLAAKEAYNWTETRPEYLQAKATAVNGQFAKIWKGVLTPTAFGLRFAKSVGIVEV
jgi:hypothetical protein